MSEAARARHRREVASLRHLITNNVRLSLELIAESRLLLAAVDRTLAGRRLTFDGSKELDPLEG